MQVHRVLVDTEVPLRSRRWHDRLPAVALAAVAAASAAQTVAATARGIGISNDGVTYLATAEGFLAGQAHTVDLVGPTHFPPGYPLLLAAVSRLSGLEPAAAARLVAVLLAVALPVAVWAAVTSGGRGSTRRGRWTAVVAAAVVAGAAATYQVGRAALSEPLFLVATLALLTAAERWARRPTPAGALALGLLGAVAASTRYLGVTAVAAVAAVVVVTAVATAMSWRRAAAHLALVTVPALGPLMLWTVTAPDVGAGSHVAPRGSRGGIDEVGRSLHEAGRALLDLWFPEQLMATAGIVVLAAPFVALAMAWWRGRGTATADRAVPMAGPTLGRLPTPTVPWAIFLVLYASLVTAQRWWVDREVLARYWLPYVAVAAVVVAQVLVDTGALHRRPSPGSREPRASRRRARTAAAAMVAVSVLAAGVLAAQHRADQIRDHRSAGSGRTSQVEATSDMLVTLVELDPQVVHTDNPPVIRHHLPDAQIVVLDEDRFACADTISVMYRRIERDVDLGAGDLVALLTEPCRTAEAVAEVLASLPGAQVIEHDDVGHLVAEGR